MSCIRAPLPVARPKAGYGEGPTDELSRCMTDTNPPANECAFGFRFVRIHAGDVLEKADPVEQVLDGSRAEP